MNRLAKEEKVKTASHTGHYKVDDFWGTIKRLGIYLSYRKWGFLLVAFVSITATIFQTLSPQVLGQATTIIYEGINQGRQLVNGQMRYPIDFDALKRVIMIVVVMYIVSATFRYLQGFFLSKLAARVIRDIRQDMRDKLNRLSIKTVDRIPNGEILSRAVNDMENVAMSLQQTIAQLLMSTTIFIGTVYMMFSISPLLSVLGISSALLGFVIIAVITPKSQKQFALQQKIQGQLNGYIEENYAGQLENKAFNQEEAKLAIFKDKSQEYYEASWKAQLLSGLLTPLMNVAKSIGYVLVAVVGGIKVANGSLPLGDVQAMLQYANMLSQPLKQTAQMVNQIQRMTTSAERIFAFLDMDEMENPSSQLPVLDTDDKMTFDHVQFGYEPGEENLLMTDFNLKVKPGEMIAIVGPTGAGKSTLINLIERFYEVSGGSIKLEGKDIRDYDKETLRNRMGMVLQDTWLFKGTIRENIKYGAHREVNDKEMVEAAQLAHADAFIRKLPHGYDTIINEDASNISQGQRQLLTITRAFISDPEILILDEATSSIDTRTEILIQRAMAKLRHGRTSFVVAHRLSTIKDADQIIVLSHGEVLETGTHESLLNQQGFYYDLYQSQFSNASE